ncbi:MAG: hypothetical protein ACXABD_16935 [Candidatus Thorarchaeota archaeon]|jgi:hypothetical protein
MCDYQSPRKFNLQRHMKKHNKPIVEKVKKLHSCCICNYKTHDKSNYNKHFKQQHTSKKALHKYRCKIMVQNKYIKDKKKTVNKPPKRYISFGKREYMDVEHYKDEIEEHIKIRDKIVLEYRKVKDMLVSQQSLIREQQEVITSQQKTIENLTKPVVDKKDLLLEILKLQGQKKRLIRILHTDLDDPEYVNTKYEYDKLCDELENKKNIYKSIDNN